MQLESDTQERYTPDPGTHPPEMEVCCGVCGDRMNLKENCYGPRGFVMAMSGSKSHYDSYTCPNSKEGWHRQVLALRKEKRETASTLVESLLDEEIKLVLESRKATKVICELHDTLGS